MRKPPHRSFLATASVLGLLAVGPVIVADAVAASPCAQIAEDRERLACYDEENAPAALSEAAASRAPASEEVTLEGAFTAPSMIDRAWGFGPDADHYAITFYRPNYFLLARYSDDVNQDPFSPIFGAADSDEELDDIEARFQLSFKARFWATEDLRWGLWLAYTQQSQWQVYNDALSSPFRETNYEPQIMLSYRPELEFGGFDFRLFNLGLVHQSNGRSQVLSRSWDRLVAEFGIEREQLSLLLRAWYRLPEDEEDDDNPDITDYLGYGDLTGVYKWRGHSFSLMVRGNWNTGKGAARLSWMTPRLLGPIRGYVVGFSGYGESMIDYNWKQNTIGIGIALNDTL